MLAASSVTFSVRRQCIVEECSKLSEQDVGDAFLLPYRFEPLKVQSLKAYRAIGSQPQLQKREEDLEARSASAFACV